MYNYLSKNIRFFVHDKIAQRSFGPLRAVKSRLFFVVTAICLLYVCFGATGQAGDGLSESPKSSFGVVPQQSNLIWKDQKEEHVQFRVAALPQYSERTASTGDMSGDKRASQTTTPHYNPAAKEDFRFSTNETVSVESQLFPSQTVTYPSSLRTVQRDTGLFAYSNDPREWVDRYSDLHQTPWDTSNSFPAGSVNTSTVSSPFGSSSSDGHQTNCNFTRQREPSTNKPNEVDLTPSYTKQLKHVATSGVLVIQTNLSLMEIKPFIKEFDALQRDLSTYLAIPVPKEKIELCLFKDEESYRAFLRELFPEAPLDRRALYVKHDGKPGVLLVQYGKNVELDVRHELTHAIVHASIPIVPIWLDEGLAKYFEIVPSDRSEKNPYIKTVRSNTKWGSVPSLKKLEKLHGVQEMGDREYRDSWAWIHFMIHHSSSTHQLLAGYFELLAELPKQGSEKKTVKIPPLSAYIDELVPDASKKYIEHFQKWGLPADEKEKSRLSSFREWWRNEFRDE